MPSYSITAVVPGSTFRGYDLFAGEARNFRELAGLEEKYFKHIFFKYKNTSSVHDVANRLILYAEPRDAKMLQPTAEVAAELQKGLRALQGWLNRMGGAVQPKSFASYYPTWLANTSVASIEDEEKAIEESIELLQRELAAATQALADVKLSREKAARDAAEKERLAAEQAEKRKEEERARNAEEQKKYLENKEAVRIFLAPLPSSKWSDLDVDNDGPFFDFEQYSDSLLVRDPNTGTMITLTEYTRRVELRGMRIKAKEFEAAEKARQAAEKIKAINGGMDVAPDDPENGDKDTNSGDAEANAKADGANQRSENASASSEGKKAVEGGDGEKKPVEGPAE